jgi:hypothetical protein
MPRVFDVRRFLHLHTPTSAMASGPSNFCLGMPTGRANRACLLNSALLETGVWCKSTAFRQPLKAASILRSVQRQPYERNRTSQR